MLSLRILDSGVIDGAEASAEDFLRLSYLTEGDGALFETALAYLGIDDFLHHRIDALLGIFRQATRSSLHSICHHEDGLLQGLGFGTRIGEHAHVDAGIGVLVLA